MCTGHEEGSEGRRERWDGMRDLHCIPLYICGRSLAGVAGFWWWEGDEQDDEEAEERPNGAVNDAGEAGGGGRPLLLPKTVTLSSNPIELLAATEEPPDPEQ